MQSTGWGVVGEPPIIHGVSQFSGLVFAIFEKAFYWSVVLQACERLWRGVRRYQDRKAMR